MGGGPTRRGILGGGEAGEGTDGVEAHDLFTVERLAVVYADSGVVAQRERRVVTGCGGPVPNNVEGPGRGDGVSGRLNGRR